MHRYVLKLEGESPLQLLIKRAVGEGQGTYCEKVSEKNVSPMLA
ncbi:hypothetical protein PARA125_001906 [Parachlamydia sp. AcF125]|nr:hypothetical protein [Parachlamydia sp. AcF125]